MPGHSQFEFHSLAANLALCGDIGNPFTAAYEEFVAVQAARFLHVFIVAGNHEFYESEYGAARERVRQVCARHANVAFLDGIQSAICDGGTVRVIGCTLWAHDSVASFNDYRVVAYGKRRLTMRDTAQLHTQEVAYIESELLQAKACGQQVVCLSHHVPYFNCPSVGTDLLPLIQGADSTLRLWCFGHTHHSVHNMQRGSCPLVSNQLGYHFSLGERDTGFRPECVAVFDKEVPTNSWVLEGPPLD
eukprot:TRINITY_DN2035_c0_g1_i1.p1 TRINITY_DN2035_c0_g1~~TRINITY_DN2035_c0_g1_i1.p1  ORF type:complete len:286 (+),score=59.87 TRINITY_DN2035_c0_g1_i1:121-858(+)